MHVRVKAVSKASKDKKVKQAETKVEETKESAMKAFQTKTKNVLKTEENVKRSVKNAKK